MRAAVLSLSHLSSILLVGLLLPSTHVLWAQRTSSLEQSAVQLPDAPSQVATVSQAQTHLHPAYKGPLFNFKQNQGQSKSWMTFLPDHTSYYRVFFNTNAVLKPDARTAEFWGKNKYFIGGASARWRMFAPSFGHGHHETIHGANALEYYGRHIPWAGPVILRIGQQAKAHPHVTSVLNTLHPRF